MFNLQAAQNSLVENVNKMSNSDGAPENDGKFMKSCFCLRRTQKYFVNIRCRDWPWGFISENSGVAPNIGKPVPPHHMSISCRTNESVVAPLDQHFARRAGLEAGNKAGRNSAKTQEWGRRLRLRIGIRTEETESQVLLRQEEASCPPED